jgi:indole-3-glycerol phosphate synthase
MASEAYSEMVPKGFDPAMRRFAEGKFPEILSLMKNPPPPVPERPGPRASLRAAVMAGRERRGIGVIAEYKRASPSLGDIDLATTPEAAAEAYRAAEAMSVLTEEGHFKGDIRFLERVEGFGGPILRKDFIFHPLQVRATAETKASALLLMIRLTPDPGQLSDLIALATDLGLEAVVEVFTAAELETARRAGAAIIQVNSRNLGDLSLDPGRALALIERERPQTGETWIAASGLKTPEDLRRASKLGYHGALVGTVLMKAPDKRAALAALLEGLADGRAPR